MDKIQKFLEFLGKKDRAFIAAILSDVQNGKIHGYDVKSLRGYKDFFRLRKGKIRIVFGKTQSGRCFIVNIAYRKDAYKNY